MRRVLPRSCPRPGSTRCGRAVASRSRAIRPTPNSATNTCWASRRSSSMKAPLKIMLLAVIAWMTALPASAHGLLARVRAEGNVIVGTVFYSSGEPAGGEWVQVYDKSNGNAKAAEFAAGAGGEFRFEGVAGH